MVLRARASLRPSGRRDPRNVPRVLLYGPERWMRASREASWNKFPRDERGSR